MTTTAISDSTSPPLRGRARPLAFTTQVAYRRDWALFTDWCTATGQQALPASPATIYTYLQATGATGSTRRRLLAAINDAHHHARQTLPQLPKPPRPHLYPDVDVPAILKRVPAWGWPTGVFGRRDAMLLLVRVQAGFTLAETAALTADQITINSDRTLQLADVQLTPTGDPRTCPACVWVRWRAVLNHARRYTPVAELQKSFTKVPEGEPAHRCQQPPSTVLQGPVLVPINQWGAMPLPLRPATTRTMTALTGAHTRGIPPHHTPRAPIVAVELPTRDDLRETPDLLHSDVRTPEQVHRDGLAARHRDHGALADLTDDFDNLDTATRELQARLDLLLADLSATHDQAAALRRGSRA